MRIGYPCINRTLECQGDKTFRLKSYSEERLMEVIDNNLNCLFRILNFNADRGILFFRITSQLIPFASHPVCRLKWQSLFKRRFANIGSFVRTKRMRLSMHPDQFILLNSLDEAIFTRSVAELEYQTKVLDLMELDSTHKIQLHGGGVYGDKPASIARFVRRFALLNERVRSRLVIENDERSYGIEDCLEISRKTGVPILFDIFHHSVYAQRKGGISGLLRRVRMTWKPKDGLPLVDYSTQKKNARAGTHALSIDTGDFRKFLKETKGFDFDVMLEIKDKEKSALKALEAAADDSRLVPKSSR